MTTEADDWKWMARAIQLARKGLYTTDPNPRVGCVLVAGGAIIGEGFHRKAGEPHAERNALADARARGHDPRGATAHVTLEPCSHQGRTPPCADGLIEAGVARVVVAMQDPNPLVAGRGIARLRDAGITVDTGVMQAQAEQLNPGFIKRMRDGLPWVRCKLAMSLDGRTAMASGESKWITSDASRADVQRLRARSSAIVTGIGTVLADDPSMNVRASLAELEPAVAGLETRQPLRVVLDSRLRIAPDARLIGLPGDTLILTLNDDPARITALRDAGAEVRVVASAAGKHPALQAVMRLLAERDINEVLIEAGPTLAGAALSAGLIDELVIYSAPHLMGDAARALFHLPGIVRMEQRIGLEIVDQRRIGPDVRTVARPRTRDPDLSASVT